MASLDPYRHELRSIQEEWNIAERDVKIGEQVSNNIVIPAIKELRYAGRRLIEALNLILTGGSEEDIRKLFQDALFDCHRARHDAVDAATSKIAIDLDLMVEKLGCEAILPVYPTFPTLIRDLQAVRAKIVETRGKREDRDAIYAALESVNFPGLVDEFNALRANEFIMKDIAAKNRSLSLVTWAGFWFGIAFGVIGTALAIIFYIFPPPSSP